ncbi:hypothetical protein [Brachyspira pulli]|uniref:hypothetical protein n=1 Tax=Brachyspira pulli TaxID=310721 RepID=UPI0030043BEC
MKKIILSILMLVSIASTSFAIGGGFEFILNVPVGISVGVYDYDLTDWAERQDIMLGGIYRNQFAKNGGIGFDIGVSAQLGYMIKFTDSIGLSILGEVGYSHDTYSYVSKIINNNSYTYSFESIQLGLLPKFNIKNFAIGIGGGIKIPLAGNYRYKTSLGSVDTKIDSDYMKITFEKAVIPYLKFTFDYSIFFTEKTAFNIGLYLGYDFGLEPNLYGFNGAVDGNRLVIDEIAYSSFDVGLQLGFKFGPSTK